TARPRALLRAGAGGEREHRQCLREITRCLFTRPNDRWLDAHGIIMPNRRKFRMDLPRITAPEPRFSRCVALTGAPTRIRIRAFPILRPRTHRSLDSPIAQLSAWPEDWKGAYSNSREIGRAH